MACLVRQAARRAELARLRRQNGAQGTALGELRASETRLVDAVVTSASERWKEAAEGERDVHERRLEQAEERCTRQVEEVQAHAAQSYMAEYRPLVQDRQAKLAAAQERSRGLHERYEKLRGFVAAAKRETAQCEAEAADKARGGPLEERAAAGGGGSADDGAEELVGPQARRAFEAARKEFLFHAQTYGAWQGVVSVLEDALDDGAVWRNPATFEKAKPALEYAMQLGDALKLR